MCPGLLGVSAWWFAQRRTAALTGFAHVELGVSVAWENLSVNGATLSGGLTDVAGFMGGASVGAEYLFSPNFGAAATLGVRVVTAPEVAAGVVGSLGVVFHQ